MGCTHMTLKYLKKIKGTTDKNGVKNDTCKHSLKEPNSDYFYKYEKEENKVICVCIQNAKAENEKYWKMNWMYKINCGTNKSQVKYLSTNTCRVRFGEYLAGGPSSILTGDKSIFADFCLILPA